MDVLRWTWRYRWCVCFIELCLFYINIETIVQIQFRKADKNGKLLVHLNYPMPVSSPDEGVPFIHKFIIQLIKNMRSSILKCSQVWRFYRYIFPLYPRPYATNILKYVGKFRASHRCTYDAKLSKPNEPYYHHSHRTPLKPSEPVDLAIPIWPIGMIFAPSESLVVRVAGHYLILPEVAGNRMPKADNDNVGIHKIWTGGKWDSHVLLPVIKGWITKDSFCEL